MLFPYLNNKPWTQITRDELFFCQRLYTLINKETPERFVTYLHEAYSLDVPTAGEWEVGYLDKPKRCTVRAVCADAKDYTHDDWRLIVENALGDWSGDDEDEAIRVAAEWARDNCGLVFERLRKGGVIFTQISLARIRYVR